MIVVKHLNRLTREIVESLSLEMLKTQHVLEQPTLTGPPLSGK